MNNDSSPSSSVASLVVESEDELDLSQLLSILWSGRWAISIFVTSFCLFGLIYYVATAPIYEADGLVQVEQDGKNMTSSMGDIASLFGAPMETQAEIQILRSRMVLNKVIDNLNLLIESSPNYFPIFGEFFARIRTNGAPLPPLFGMDRYAWSSESIQISTFEVPEIFWGEKFTVSALQAGHFTLSDFRGNDLFHGIVGQATEAQTPQGPIRLFVRDIKAHAGTRFTLTRWSRAEVLSQLEKKLKVAEAGKQSGVIRISVEGKKPQGISAIIQEIEDAYVRQNVERRSAEAQQSLEFLQKQLPEIKANVDSAQTRLNTYQQMRGSVDITKETELVLQQAVDFETKRLELIGQREQAIQRFTSQHPAVQALDAQIQGFENEEHNIRKRAESLPKTQQEILSLMRELEVNTQIYTTLLNSAQELQVAKAGTVGNVRIIDPPVVPTKRSKPKLPLVLAISLAAGFGCGVGYIFVQTILFRGVDRPDDVEKALGLATYAAIPYTSTQKRLANLVQRKQTGSHILASTEPDNVAIEALRSLRTSLQFALLESSNNVVMFTGPVAGLGKSFISLNLGAVSAKSGRKVVVVDSDMRRGHLHKYIGESKSPGLSDYVVGNADFESIIRSTEVDGLFLVTNGTNPPNPSELLLNPKFSNFLERLSKSFDLVILDTPPVLPVADAGIIGRLAGCVLIVLKEGAHPMRMVEETVRRLRQAGVQVRGTIFNQVGQRRNYGYYYSSYGYTYTQKYGSNERES